MAEFASSDTVRQVEKDVTNIIAAMKDKYDDAQSAFTAQEAAILRNKEDQQDAKEQLDAAMEKIKESRRSVQHHTPAGYSHRAHKKAERAVPQVSANF